MENDTKNIAYVDGQNLYLGTTQHAPLFLAKIVGATGRLSGHLISYQSFAGVLLNHTFFPETVYQHLTHDNHLVVWGYVLVRDWLDYGEIQAVYQSQLELIQRAEVYLAQFCLHG